MHPTHFSLILAALFLFIASPCGAEPGSPAAGPSLVGRIETLRGKPLNEKQRAQCAEAMATARQGMVEAQKKFVASLVAITGLPEADIQPMMPVIGQPLPPGFDKNAIPKIEAKLGRKLSEQEMARIREADKAKKDAIHPIRRTMCEKLSSLSGIDAARIEALLPKVGI